MTKFLNNTSPKILLSPLKNIKRYLGFFVTHLQKKYLEEKRKKGWKYLTILGYVGLELASKRLKILVDKIADKMLGNLEQNINSIQKSCFIHCLSNLTKSLLLYCLAYFYHVQMWQNWGKIIGFKAISGILRKNKVKSFIS
jgi:hypothetical protein